MAFRAAQQFALITVCIKKGHQRQSSAASRVVSPDKGTKAAGGRYQGQPARRRVLRKAIHISASQTLCECWGPPGGGLAAPAGTLPQNEGWVLLDGLRISFSAPVIADPQQFALITV